MAPSRHKATDDDGPAHSVSVSFDTMRHSGHALGTGWSGPRPLPPATRSDKATRAQQRKPPLEALWPFDLWDAKRLRDPAGF